MRVVHYLVLLAFLSGALACITSVKPQPVPVPDPVPRLDCECGRRPRNVRHKRIVGGSDTTRSEFPWMVSILHRAGGFCGGTLISDRTVLTAAHCLIDDEDPSNYRVIIGERIQGDIYIVQSVECHANYEDSDMYTDYDYAIIQLENSVRFTETVYSICLPKDGRYDVGRGNVIGIGWGATVIDGNRPSNVLQKAKFKTADHEYRCTRLGMSQWWLPWWWLSGRVPERRTRRMLCLLGTAADEGGKTYSGLGDSGGPVMVEFNPGQDNAYYVQTGIFSFKSGSKSTGLRYDLAARVSDQIDWIKDRIEGSVCNNPAEDDIIDSIIDL